MKKAIIVSLALAAALFLPVNRAASQDYMNGRAVEYLPYPYKNLLFTSPRFDRQNQLNGNYFNTYLLRTVFTYKGKSHFRLDLPLANSNISGKDVFGMSDMNIRYVYAVPLSKSNSRLYGGISGEAVFPTATDKSLGAGKWQMWPGFGVFYFRGEGKNTTGTMSLMVEYRFSYAGPKDRTDVKILAAAPNIDWWFKKGYIGYYATWTYNFENEILDIPLDVEAGYFLTSRLVVSAEFIQPLLKKRTYNNEYGLKLRYNF